MKDHNFISSENISNTLPDCVNLKIDWGQWDGDGRCLRMHVNFGEQEDLVNGKVLKRYTLAVRRGKLILHIENGHSPAETWEYAFQIPPHTDAEISQTDSVKEARERTGELTSGIGFEGGSPKSLVGSKASDRHLKERSGGTTIQHDFQLLHVEAEGSETEPKWTFNPVNPYTYLRGYTRTDALATVYAHDETCRIMIRFQVRDSDFEISQISGLWLDGLRSLAGTKIIKHLILKQARKSAGDNVSEGEISFSG